MRASGSKKKVSKSIDPQYGSRRRKLFVNAAATHHTLDRTRNNRACPPTTQPWCSRSGVGRRTTRSSPRPRTTTTRKVRKSCWRQSINNPITCPCTLHPLTPKPTHPDPPQPSPAHHRPRSWTSPSCVPRWACACCFCSCAGASSTAPRTARRSSGAEMPARQQGPGRQAVQVQRACRLSRRAAPSWMRRSACRGRRRGCLRWGSWKR